MIVFLSQCDEEGLTKRIWGESLHQKRCQFQVKSLQRQKVKCAAPRVTHRVEAPVVQWPLSSTTSESSVQRSGPPTLRLAPSTITIPLPFPIPKPKYHFQYQNTNIKTKIIAWPLFHHQSPQRCSWHHWYQCQFRYWYRFGIGLLLVMVFRFCYWYCSIGSPSALHWPPDTGLGIIQHSSILSNSIWIWNRISFATNEPIKSKEKTCRVEKSF